MMNAKLEALIGYLANGSWIFKQTGRVDTVLKEPKADSRSMIGQRLIRFIQLYNIELNKASDSLCSENKRIVSI